MQMPWQVSGEVNWQDQECDVLLTPLKETKPLSISVNQLIPPLISPFSNVRPERELLGAQQIHIHR